MVGRAVIPPQPVRSSIWSVTILPANIQSISVQKLGTDEGQMTAVVSGMPDTCPWAAVFLEAVLSNVVVLVVLQKGDTGRVADRFGDGQRLWF